MARNRRRSYFLGRTWLGRRGSVILEKSRGDVDGEEGRWSGSTNGVALIAW